MGLTWSVETIVVYLQLLLFSFHGRDMDRSLFVARISAQRKHHGIIKERTCKKKKKNSQMVEKVG